MHIMLTVLSGIAAFVCGFCIIRALTYVDGMASHERRVVALIANLKAERDRVTVLERDTAALRRELRKLSGKFYAERREMDLETLLPNLQPEQHVIAAPFCANYGQAQIDGPRSEAASCECAYCVEMRARRAKFRAEAVKVGRPGDRLAAESGDGE